MEISKTRMMAKLKLELIGRVSKDIALKSTTSCISVFSATMVFWEDDEDEEEGSLIWGFPKCFLLDFE